MKHQNEFEFILNNSCSLSQTLIQLNITMNRNQDKNFFSKIRETISKDITIILILALGSVFQFSISIKQISSANYELGFLNLGIAMILLGGSNKAKTFKRKASLLLDEENKEDENTYGIEYIGLFFITLAALSALSKA